MTGNLDLAPSGLYPKVNSNFGRFGHYNGAVVRYSEFARRVSSKRFSYKKKWWITERKINPNA